MLNHYQQIPKKYIYIINTVNLLLLFIHANNPPNNINVFHVIENVLYLIYSVDAKRLTALLEAKNPANVTVANKPKSALFKFFTTFLNVNLYILHHQLLVHL